MDDVLKNKIEELPDGAGVYFFKDVAERVIYVGKAKNLKKRVKNHFQKPDQHSFDFVSQIASIDFIQTSSEKEALLLEQPVYQKAPAALECGMERRQKLFLYCFIR